MVTSPPSAIVVFFGKVVFHDMRNFPPAQPSFGQVIGITSSPHTPCYRNLSSSSSSVLVCKGCSSHGPSLESARANAPHMFNAVYSSMRKWESSLNHNGMSIFLARIPNNTHLYHRTTYTL